MNIYEKYYFNLLADNGMHYERYYYNLLTDKETE